MAIQSKQGTPNIQPIKTSTAKLNKNNTVKTNTIEQYNSSKTVEEINLDTTFSSETVNSTQTYQFSLPVKQGDTLSKIAKENNVSLEALLEANPNLKEHPDDIDVGDIIKIPVNNANDNQSTSPMNNNTTNQSSVSNINNVSNQENMSSSTSTKSTSDFSRSGSKNGTKLESHTVNQGETLSKIARDNGISLKELLMANPEIINPNIIEIGQIIQIPVSLETLLIDKENLCINYSVKQGDTLSKIAEKYELDYHYLAEINNISDPNYIEIGQIIYIPNQEKVNTYYIQLLNEAIESIQNGESLNDTITKMQLASKYIASNITDKSQNLIQNIKNTYSNLINEIVNKNLLNDKTTFNQLNEINTILENLYSITVGDLEKVKETIDDIKGQWEKDILSGEKEQKETPKVEDQKETPEVEAEVTEVYNDEDIETPEIDNQELPNETLPSEEDQIETPKTEEASSSNQDVQIQDYQPSQEFQNAIDQMSNILQPQVDPEVQEFHNMIDQMSNILQPQVDPETQALHDSIEQFESISSQNKTTDTKIDTMNNKTPEVEDKKESKEAEQVSSSNQDIQIQDVQENVETTPEIDNQKLPNETLPNKEDQIETPKTEETSSNNQDVQIQDYQSSQEFQNAIDQMSNILQPQVDPEIQEFQNKIGQMSNILQPQVDPEIQALHDSIEQFESINSNHQQNETSETEISNNTAVFPEINDKVDETDKNENSNPISNSSSSVLEEISNNIDIDTTIPKISPYQDLIDSIPSSPNKNIDLSNIQPGSPVAEALEKYGNELITATYAVVNDKIFITISEDTIDGNTNYVSHIVINDPSQITGIPANGLYGNGLETATNAAYRLNTTFLINGSHFTSNGQQDLQGENHIVIANGQVQAGSFAGGMEICLDKNGNLFNATPGTSAQDLINKGVTYTFSSHDSHLINNGVNHPDAQDSAYNSTVIGMVKPGEYYITTGSSTNYGAANYLENKGCYFAKSMDQGGSVSLVININGKQIFVNEPTDTVEGTDVHVERSVGDFLAFY